MYIKVSNSTVLLFSCRRYDHVTDLLHRGEPCTSCGLRFTEDQRDAYQQHLDWHYQENRMDKEGTRGMMRNWYLHPDVSGGRNRLLQHVTLFLGLVDIWRDAITESKWYVITSKYVKLSMSITEPVLTREEEVREESIGRDEERSGVSCQVLLGEDDQVRFGVHCWNILSCTHTHRFVVYVTSSWNNFGKKTRRSGTLETLSVSQMVSYFIATVM